MARHENRKSSQRIAGPHVEAGQAKFGAPVRQGGEGLRTSPQRGRGLVDQDTIGKHPAATQPRKLTNLRKPATDAQHASPVRGPLVAAEGRANQAPEGVWRERQPPLNKSTGRHAATKGGAPRKRK